MLHRLPGLVSSQTYRQNTRQFPRRSFPILLKWRTLFSLWVSKQIHPISTNTPDQHKAAQAAHLSSNPFLCACSLDKISLVPVIELCINCGLARRMPFQLLIRACVIRGSIQTMLPSLSKGLPNNFAPRWTGFVGLINWVTFDCSLQFTIRGLLL